VHAASVSPPRGRRDASSAAGASLISTGVSLGRVQVAGDATVLAAWLVLQLCLAALDIRGTVENRPDAAG